MGKMKKQSTFFRISRQIDKCYANFANPLSLPIMEPLKKIVFIVNPISGTFSKDFVLASIKEQINRAKFTYEVAYTQHAKHGTEISAKAVANGADIVVCGSGNGLARHLQIPMDIKKAIENINRCNIECIDYGRINNNPFFCTCGVGFDAFVSLKFATAGKRGMLTYLENTLHECLNYKPETYEIVREDSTMKHKAFLIACANASQYGNNAYIAPQASLDDGLMDVTILEPFTILDIPALAFQLFNKNIDQNSRIKTFKSNKITIIRNKPGVIHFDGDPVMEGSVLNVEIVGHDLWVCVPPEKGRKTGNMLQMAADYFSGFKPFSGVLDELSAKNKIFMERRKDESRE